jgi:hypothetical protein
VALVERRVLLDDVGEGLHLLGGHAAEGQLHANHLDVGLALAVDALPKAELDEVVLGDVASEVALGFVVEVVELALEDRDDVAGHVLDDLGVLERSLAPLLLEVLDRRLLHRARSPMPKARHGAHIRRRRRQN